MHLHRKLLALGIAAALTIPLAAQATNGYLSHGYGTKSKGMAGAGSALPQDAMSATANVAGMVWVGQRLDFGIAFFAPHREYTQNSQTNSFPPEAIQAGMAPPWPMPVGSRADFTGTVESENDLFLIPHFAYNHPLDEISSIGAALYGNGGMNTTYDHHDTTKIPGTPAANGLGTYGGAFANPSAADTGVDLMQLALNLNYSRKLADNFSVGVGVILATQMFKAKGLTPLGDLAADGNPDNLSNRGRESVFGWGAQFGALWQVNDQLSLAAAYQTQVDFNRFKKYGDLFAENGDLDAPAFANLGIAFKATPTLTFAFDLQHIWYSDVAALGNNMTTNIELCMQGQTQYCLGGKKGVGFGWKDMTVYKFGAQWEMRPDLTLRAGYSYGRQPIPTEGVLFNVIAPALIEQHFTLGLTKTMNKNTEINVAAMYAPRKELDCGCTLPFSGGPKSINIAMDQWELEVGIGMRF